MSEFCNTCAAMFIIDEYYAYKDNPAIIPDEYRPIELYYKLRANEQEERKWIRELLKMDNIPVVQSRHNVMICEGCSRKGSLICIIDNDGYCVSPNCDTHSAINIAKGWYEIGGDEKTLGELRNKKWDT